MTSEVVARLILRPPADTGDAFVREAQRRLIDLGFRVEQVDPGGVSFTADQIRFEEVFHTRLIGREATILPVGQRDLKRGHFEASEPINMPVELADVATAVVLPLPPQLFP